jgi:hypothetical protein
LIELADILGLVDLTTAVGDQRCFIRGDLGDRQATAGGLED